METFESGEVLAKSELAIRGAAAAEDGVRSTAIIPKDLLRSSEVKRPGRRSAGEKYEEHSAIYENKGHGRLTFLVSP